MNEITPVLNQLAGDHGWLAAAMGWLLAAQTIAKLIQPKVTEAMTRFMLQVLRSKDKADDDRLERVLGSWQWFVAYEVLDLTLRLKLPTEDNFEELKKGLAAPAPAAGQ